MDIDVARARMTKREGGSSDYDYCARKCHTAKLRVAASPGRRGLYYTQVPPVVKLRHSVVVSSDRKTGAWIRYLARKMILDAAIGACRRC